MVPKTGSSSWIHILASTCVILGIFLMVLLPAQAGWSGSFLPLVARDWQSAPDVYSPILISEVLFDPVEEEPDYEWVEIYNRGPALISLTTYKIGDAELQNDQEGMYHFPPKVFIVPGQVLVIANRGDAFMAAYGFAPQYEFFDTVPTIPNMVKYKNWSNGSINLSSGGDDVLLLDPEDRVLDAVSWGSSTFAFEPSIEGVSEGESIERRPADQDSDGASDWDVQPSPKPGQVNLVPDTPVPTKSPTNTPKPCSPPTVLVSEVYYDPLGDLDPQAEWMELINVGNEPVNLACLKIGDEETLGGGEGMAKFPPGEAIDPGQVALVAVEAESFFNNYGFDPDYEAVDSKLSVPDLIPYDLWASGRFNLSNAGDDVLILDDHDVVVDAVSWGDSTFAFDPPVDPVAEGHSIERVPPFRDTGTAMDWVDSAEPSPGEASAPPGPTGSLTPTVSVSPTTTPTATRTPIPCGQVPALISEVYYDPIDSDDPDGEWIEIHNPGETVINLACVKIGDEETQGGGEGMVGFPQGSSLEPGGIILVAYKGTSFISQFGFTPDYEIQDSHSAIPDMKKYADWASGSINLSNAGDDVLLLDGDDALVDAVSWGSSNFAFEPSVPSVPEGHSIERKPADRDTDEAADWIDQTDPDPGNVDLEPSPATTTPARTPTPTPTRTPSRTPTPSPTRTPNLSPTMTPTQTPTEAANSGLVINEVHADPDPSLGDANADGAVGSSDDEFVEIINSTNDPLDLSSWTLHDAVGVRHVFAGNSILPAGCAVVVFGGGTPMGDFGSSLVQIASSGTLSLNDFGDILSLFDFAGNFVVSLTYGTEAGDNQSITRFPDITGSEPLSKHSIADGLDGSLFSPGTRISGDLFMGCLP